MVLRGPVRLELPVRERPPAALRPGRRSAAGRGAHPLAGRRPDRGARALRRPRLALDRGRLAPLTARGLRNGLTTEHRGHREDGPSDLYGCVGVWVTEPSNPVLLAVLA